MVTLPIGIVVALGIGCFLGLIVYVLAYVSGEESERIGKQYDRELVRLRKEVEKARRQENEPEAQDFSLKPTMYHSYYLGNDQIFEYIGYYE